MTMHQRGGYTLACMGALLLLALLLSGCASSSHDGETAAQHGARMDRIQRGLAGLRDTPKTPTVIIVHE